MEYVGQTGVKEKRLECTGQNMRTILLIVTTQRFDYGDFNQDDIVNAVSFRR